MKTRHKPLPLIVSLVSVTAAHAEPPVAFGKARTEVQAKPEKATRHGEMQLQTGVSTRPGEGKPYVYPTGPITRPILLAETQRLKS